jgi:hypothetical protein
MQFDPQDKAILHALDDFEIGNEVAVISGPMTIEIIRLAADGGDQFELKLKLPGGEPLDIKILNPEMRPHSIVDQLKALRAWRRLLGAAGS